MSNFAKKLIRKKVREAKKAARKTANAFYANIVQRKRELRRTGVLNITYHVSKPDKVGSYLTLEDFGEAGCLIYMK